MDGVGERLFNKYKSSKATLGSQVYLGKKHDKGGIGHSDNSFQIPRKSKLYGRFVKEGTSAKTVDVIQLSTFQFMSGKGGNARNSAKLKRMAKLYEEDAKK